MLPACSQHRPGMHPTCPPKSPACSPHVPRMFWGPVKYTTQTNGTAPYDVGTRHRSIKSPDHTNFDHILTLLHLLYMICPFLEKSNIHLAIAPSKIARLRMALGDPSSPRRARLNVEDDGPTNAQQLIKTMFIIITISKFKTRCNTHGCMIKG